MNLAYEIFDLSEKLIMRVSLSYKMFGFVHDRIFDSTSKLLKKEKEDFFLPSLIFLSNNCGFNYTNLSLFTVNSHFLTLTPFFLAC